jgi:hypothetical protein
MTSEKEWGYRQNNINIIAVNTGRPFYKKTKKGFSFILLDGVSV